MGDKIKKDIGSLFRKLQAMKCLDSALNINKC